MLKIINNLGLFFDDCYRQIGVREYAKITKISPPTASKLLKTYQKQGLLISQTERRYLLFKANQENKDFIDLSRIHWRKKLQGLCEELSKKLLNPACVLFGSLAKAENKQDSDIDLAVFAPENKQINLETYKTQLKREISIYFYTSLKDIKNKHLLNNILSGYILQGKIKWE